MANDKLILRQDLSKVLLADSAYKINTGLYYAHRLYRKLIDVSINLWPCIDVSVLAPPWFASDDVRSDNLVVSPSDVM